MSDYTFAEYTDMVLIYGEAQGDAEEARRLYTERFPKRKPPSCSTIINLIQRLRETGTLFNLGNLRTNFFLILLILCIINKFLSGSR